MSTNPRSVFLFPAQLDLVHRVRELLIEAPYQAAEQVFETALAEDVDAVLLAGDVLNVDRAGPPAIVLLLDQFSRLGDRGIPVYWAGGAVDAPDLWPRSVALPQNVHVFPVGRVETLDLVRSGEAIARVHTVPVVLEEALERAQAPTTPGALGFTPEIWAEATANAHLIRNRFTFLDLI